MQLARLFVRGTAGTVVALLLVTLVALGYRAFRQHQVAEWLAIDTRVGIAEARFVAIGGIDQWITIRGEYGDHPVLLVLAGGPGNSLVPLTPVFKSWERGYIVVQWDQRGAGKTYGANARDTESMTMDQMVADGIELSRYLLEHLHKSRLAVIGHSWGSMLGATMVKRAPQLYCAFVGTGHVVAKAEKEDLLYASLLEELRRAGDDAGVAELQSVGPPPYASQHDLLVQRRLSERFDTPAERNLFTEMRAVVLFAPDFSIFDILSMLRGDRFASEALYAETLGFDARALGMTFEVPFFVFNGDRDRITPLELAHAYFDDVSAPEKALVVLPGGGHSAMLTMPGEFLAALQTHVRPECNAR